MASRCTESAGWAAGRTWTEHYFDAGQVTSLCRRAFNAISAREPGRCYVCGTCLTMLSKRNRERAAAPVGERGTP